MALNDNLCKDYKGKISALHGKKGNVRAIFEDKGLPGQALGTKIKVELKQN